MQRKRKERLKKFIVPSFTLLAKKNPLYCFKDGFIEDFIDL